MVTAEYSYDAWGRRRDKDDWSYTLSGEPELLAGRSFTSHEYLPWFNLYNMNGRLYDPVVGRFLSPDENVQMPDFSQNFNRYSYALNNPLVYVDSDGEIVLLAAVLIGAAVGGVVNYGIQVASNYVEGHRGAEAWLNKIDWFDVGVGAVVGGISGGAGAGVTASSSFGKSIMKFAGSKTWSYINTLGVSAISSSFDLTTDEGFHFNGWEEASTNYISGMIFNRASQVSGKKAIDLYSSIGEISFENIGKYSEGILQNMFIGTMENILFNKGIKPIFEPRNNPLPPPPIPELDKPFQFGIYNILPEKRNNFNQDISIILTLVKN